MSQTQAQRNWYLRNRERILAERAANYAANPERFRERTAAWANANPDSFREKSRHAHAADPSLSRRSSASYRARKRDAFVETIDPLIVLERDDGECGVCHKDVDPMNFVVDHVIPLSRGGLHAYSNTQVAHDTCNWRKAANLV